MNKLIIDKATDKEKRIIREKISCLLDELDEKDKKKIYFVRKDNFSTRLLGRKVLELK